MTEKHAYSQEHLLAAIEASKSELQCARAALDAQKRLLADEKVIRSAVDVPYVWRKSASRVDQPQAVFMLLKEQTTCHMMTFSEQTVSKGSCSSPFELEWFILKRTSMLHCVRRSWSLLPISSLEAEHYCCSTFFSVSKVFGGVPTGR